MIPQHNYHDMPLLVSPTMLLHAARILDGIVSHVNRYGEINAEQVDDILRDAADGLTAEDIGRMGTSDPRSAAQAAGQRLTYIASLDGHVDG